LDANGLCAVYRARISGFDYPAAIHSGYQTGQAECVGKNFSMTGDGYLAAAPQAI
jgi:hypothetical protein